MTAYARRREIGIMRLVGASSWHIQLPFVLESMIAALISAALAAVGLAAFMYFVVYGYLRDTLGKITTWVRWQEAFVVMGYTTVLALLLGAGSDTRDDAQIPRRVSVHDLKSHLVTCCHSGHHASLREKLPPRSRSCYSTRVEP